MLYLILLTSLCCNAQKNIEYEYLRDTAKIFHQAKLRSVFMSYDNYADSQKIDYEIRNMSLKLLKQKGFGNVIFFKIKIMPRDILELTVFRELATIYEETMRSTGHDSLNKIISIDSLQRAIIEKKFLVNKDLLSNDFYESIIPADKMNILRAKYDNAFFEYYYLYWFKESCYYLIRKNKKYQYFNNYFRDRIYDDNENDEDDFFVGKAREKFRPIQQYYFQYPFLRFKVLPKEVLKELDVEEIGVDFLKFLPIEPTKNKVFY